MNLWIKRYLLPNHVGSINRWQVVRQSIIEETFIGNHKRTPDTLVPIQPPNYFPNPKNPKPTPPHPITNMAADTRDPPYPPSPSPSTPYRFPSSLPSTSAPESANLLPGGSTNTAGHHRPHEATLLEAAKTVKLSELKDVHKRPCVRDALMVGIAGGFGVGGIRAILGGMISPSSSATFPAIRSPNVGKQRRSGAPAPMPLALFACPRPACTSSASGSARWRWRA